MEFRELAGVSPEILRAVEDMGFSQMTEVQEKAIPVMLSGREIIAKAPTGTGKTCAFGIPLVERALLQNAPWVQSVVLCPTRELCTQIVEELRALAKYKEGLRVAAIYGGQAMNPQIEALKKHPQIVVATPGRMLDHMKRRTIRLDKVSTVVLDEADEMLDMGFFKDVRKILDSLPKKEQMVMFSATISREVMDIGWLQRDAEEITVRPVEESRPRITQYCCCTTGRKRFLDLVAILKKENLDRVLIFCNTKYNTAMICDMLTRQGLPAQCIHGDMIQKERNRVMAKFKEGEIPVMVATDVAARGIDVTDIDAVVNYDFPQDNETYVHRIGRTARAQKEGISYLFYSADERTRLKNLIRYTRFEIAPIAVSEDGIISPAEGL